MSALNARIEDVREFFLQKQAEARAEKLTVDARAAIAKSLAMARQKREAAETLWLGGCQAEALPLAKQAFEGVVAAAEASGEPAPNEATVALQKRLEATKLPEVDADVTRDHAELFDALLDAHDKRRRALFPLELGKKGIARRRVERLVGLGAGFVAFVVLMWWIVRKPPVIHATASAEYSEKYPASYAVDGDNDTEWLLPDRTPGSIELRPTPVKPMKAIGLLNCHSPPGNDRATKDFEVRAYSGATLVKTATGTFPELLVTPPWQSVPLECPNCDRIVVEVKTWHMAGGGLAEVKIE